MRRPGWGGGRRGPWYLAEPSGKGGTGASVTSTNLSPRPQHRRGTVTTDMLQDYRQSDS